MRNLAHTRPAAPGQRPQTNTTAAAAAAAAAAPGAATGAKKITNTEAGTIPSAATARQAPGAQAGPGVRASHGSPAATFAPPNADLEFGRLDADPVPRVAVWDRFAGMWTTGITIVGLVITFVIFAVVCPGCPPSIPLATLPRVRMLQ
ncbi:g5999 [Coccomyxa elongata]